MSQLVAEPLSDEAAGGWDFRPFPAMEMKPIMVEFQSEDVSLWDSLFGRNRTVTFLTPKFPRVNSLWRWTGLDLMAEIESSCVVAPGDNDCELTITAGETPTYRLVLAGRRWPFFNLRRVIRDNPVNR